MRCLMLMMVLIVSGGAFAQNEDEFCDYADLYLESLREQRNSVDIAYYTAQEEMDEKIKEQKDLVEVVRLLHLTKTYGAERQKLQQDQVAMEKVVQMLACSEQEKMLWTDPDKQVAQAAATGCIRKYFNASALSTGGAIFSTQDGLKSLMRGYNHRISKEVSKLIAKTHSCFLEKTSMP